MAVLHIINKSPFQQHSLESCLRLAKKGSAILFIEDAIYAAQNNTGVSDTVSNAIGKHMIYALTPDLLARGIAQDNVIDGFSLLDYDGFVQLTTEYATVQSWL